jgi:Uma2 family endonuclease
MGAVPATQHMTAQEYLDLPAPLQRPNTELVEGEIVVNEPTRLHQAGKLELIFALGGWSRQAPGRGRTWLPLDVLIDQRNVFAPDILWYAEGVGPDIHGSPPSPLPHLAVEIRSPSTWRYDIGAKKAAYERAGLRELWLVDTAASEVLVFLRSEAGAPGFDISLELERDHTLTSPQLVGFELPLAELFPE